MPSLLNLAEEGRYYDGLELERLRAEIRRLRAALEFYARPIAYSGGNIRNEGQDHKFTPPDAPYIRDVGRDGGAVAREALNNQSHSSSPSHSEDGHS
jgi:hypothetical protein